MSYTVSIVLDKSRHPMCNLHLLHVGISSGDAEKLGFSSSNAESSYENFYAVLYHSECEKLCTPKHKINGLFITVLVTDNTHLTSCSDTLNLFATTTFFKHYNLEIGMKFFCAMIQPITLEHVTLGAKSLEAYKWVKKENWKNNILNYQNERALCRNGDPLLLNLNLINSLENYNLIYDIVVLECGPVHQGLITKDTSVIIIKLTTDEINGRTNESEKLIADSKISITINSYLNLMNFTSRLLIINHGYIHNKSNCLETHKNVVPILKTLATSNAALQVLRNSKLLHTEIMPKITDFKSGEDMDIHNSVYVNSADLITTGIDENAKHNWVYIKLNYQDTDEIDDVDGDWGKWRLVKVYASPTIFPIGKAHVTPQLWFNLNQHPSPLLQTCGLLFKAANPDPIISYAKEVYLALIPSPNYSSTQNFDILLKNYFETTKYLKVGDVIALSLLGDAKIHETNSDSFNTDSSWNQTIYFNVSRIEPTDGKNTIDKNCFYKIDTLHSRLYQSGTKESYIPVTMETFNRRDPFHRLWDAPVLPGSVGRIRDQLFSIISPFLKSQQLRERVSTNILLSGPVGSGKKLVLKAVCRSLNMHFYSVDCQELVGDAAGATEMRLRNCATKALKYAPVIFHLNNISLLSREKKDASTSNGEDPRTISNFGQILATLSGPECESNWPLIAVATTTTSVGSAKSGKGDSLHPDLASLFMHHICMETPNEEDRASILEFLLPLDIQFSISINKIAQKTAGFVLSDLNELVSLSMWNAFKRVKNYLLKNKFEVDENEIALAGIVIEQIDIDLSLEKLQNVQAQSIGAPKIPNVRWDDVGGLEEVKKEILNTIQLPLNHPELIYSGLKRSGILLHGPPGTGKTLLAKAVATECSLNFLSVKGPELINMYVGQSEENVREVFHRARSASPCVIFFDELDSLAPNRGLSGDSGGVMDRVVSQLLAELDGINQTTANIFVIGATNRPDLLDPALLRPGRFDRLVELGVAKTSQERLNILKALTRKMPISDDINLEEIEKISPEGLTGADFYSLCSDAQTKALERCIIMLEEGKEQEDNLKPEIKMDDFVSSLKTLIPSVSK